jgi:hypothetical protein
MRSPGYANVIQWISEIWRELEPSIIADSFDACGITASSVDDLHSALKAYLQSGTTDFVEDYDQASEIRGFDDQFVAVSNESEISQTYFD